MSIEIEGTVAKVAVGYSLKVPAGVAYSSEDAHVSYSIEFDVAGKTLDEITEALEALEAQLHVNAKLAAFAQLGIEFETSAAGVISPVIKSAPAKAAAPRPSNNGQASRPQGQQYQNTPPKVDNSQKPVVVLGGKAYYDQRGAKESGAYKPGAADFKSIESTGVTATGQKAYSQLWIVERDGAENAEVAALMAEAGL